MIAIMLRDKLDKLVLHKIEEPSHWIFQSQIRYYIELAEHINNDANKTFMDLKSQIRRNKSGKKSGMSMYSYKKITSEMTVEEQIQQE
jgi:hypothetical protein